MLLIIKANILLIIIIYKFMWYNKKIKVGEFMKKKILFVSIFILITIVAFFIVSSFSHSNSRFKIYFSNVEEYQEDEYQGQLNYYLSDDDTIFYFDYRSNNTFLKQLDLETGDKKEIISLKEHTNFDQEFIFAESLDYYNVIYNNN